MEAFAHAKLGTVYISAALQPWERRCKNASRMRLEQLVTCSRRQTCEEAVDDQQLVVSPHAEQKHLSGSSSRTAARLITIDIIKI